MSEDEALEVVTKNPGLLTCNPGMLKDQSADTIKRAATVVHTVEVDKECFVTDKWRNVEASMNLRLAYLLMFICPLFPFRFSMQIRFSNEYLIAAICVDTAENSLFQRFGAEAKRLSLRRHSGQDGFPPPRRFPLQSARRRCLLGWHCGGGASGRAMGRPRCSLSCCLSPSSNRCWLTSQSFSNLRLAVFLFSLHNFFQKWNVLTKPGRTFEIGAVQKSDRLVDLETCWKMCAEDRRRYSRDMALRNMPKVGTDLESS